ncbi:TrlF family AAA-like ATPase [uncultured Chryseobacterium sp.]|uniref:TrlF family AAA-like ATPase n=1 Tax=uncultured Chryseobacterium sp. TaxID=259322 RepID=UPI0025FE4DFA|nr:PHP domain-containing protein [uncultured Chryseobacterium sp.]
MINNQAKFLRGDLHIHSYGSFGSFDVTDTTMTPQAIVDTAIEKNLKIISITDHNEIQNSYIAIEYAKDKNILVVPGIEVSTTQGHLLLYFETFDNLRNFYGNLSIVKESNICTQGIVDCLNYANQHGGFGILAHIELSSGFEKTLGKFGPQIEEIFKVKNLLAFEIKSRASVDLYTEKDISEQKRDRMNLINMRINHLKLEKDYNIPKIISSDSHTLIGLGKNADGENKLTRYKVDELNFHSIKIALQYYESRIRLENEIPEKRPYIKEIKLTGGLFKDTNITLSNNLTCIIGSRGAGKSTFLESIREGSGNKSKYSVVDSEVWPQQIDLIYHDETDQQIHFVREKHSNIRNNTDPINGINKIEIETYGQGETAETLQHSDENPKVLINFLDSFLNLNSLTEEDENIIKELLENQSESKKLRIDLLSYDETQKALKNEEKKLENLKKEKAGELVTFQNSLIKEREIRKSLINKLNDIIKTYRDIFADQSHFTTFFSITDDEIVVGKDFFKTVKNIVTEFSTIVKEKSTELTTELNLKIENLKIELQKWSDKEKDIQEKIDLKKAQFEQQGIPFDLGKINQISKDILDYQNKIVKLDRDRLLLAEYQKNRIELIAKRFEVKEKIHQLRKAFSKKANENLKNTIEGFFITIKYRNGLFSPEFEDLLKIKMDWRQNKKAKVIANTCSVYDFLEICESNNFGKILEMKDENENNIFSESESLIIIKKIQENYTFEDFEALRFDDLPEITITRSYQDENGKVQYLSKPLSKLSLGQQQSVLLGILMLSDSNKPLIIDQPEDNLDSEFIFKTIVKNLRKIKEQRQVIIVTHNPNIAVLGDAELIIPLKSTNILTHIMHPGSIDRTETRAICCEILEGGKRAFEQRKEIYGIK